jgi:hypothetical protein
VKSPSEKSSVICPNELTANNNNRTSVKNFMFQSSGIKDRKGEVINLRSSDFFRTKSVYFHRVCAEFHVFWPHLTQFADRSCPF